MRQRIIDATIPHGGGTRTIASAYYPQDFAHLDCVTGIGSAIAYLTGVMSAVKANVHPGLIVAERGA